MACRCFNIPSKDLRHQFIPEESSAESDGSEFDFYRKVIHEKIEQLNKNIEKLKSKETSESSSNEDDGNDSHQEKREM